MNRLSYAAARRVGAVGVCALLIGSGLSWAAAAPAPATPIQRAFLDGVVTQEERRNLFAQARELLDDRQTDALSRLHAAFILHDEVKSAAALSELLKDPTRHRDAKIEAYLLHAHTVFAANWRQPDRALKGFEQLEAAVLEFGLPGGGERHAFWPIHRLDWQLEYLPARAAVALYAEQPREVQLASGELFAEHLLRSMDRARLSWPEVLAVEWGRYSGTVLTPEEFSYREGAVLDEYRQLTRHLFAMAESLRASGRVPQAESIAYGAAEAALSGLETYSASAGPDFDLSRLSAESAYVFKAAASLLPPERAVAVFERAARVVAPDLTLTGNAELIGLRWTRDRAFGPAARLWTTLLEVYDGADDGVFDPSRRAMALVQRAQAWIGLGQLAEAEADIERVRLLLEASPELLDRDALLRNSFGRVQRLYERAVATRSRH